YQEKATTQAFILYDKKQDQDTIVVAVKRTEPFDADAWCSDFDLSWYELEGMGKIHGGFMKALGLHKNIGPRITQEHCHPKSLAYYAIRDILKQHLGKNDRATYILAGHSLGRALAILFPAVLIFHEETWLLDRLEEVYTFRQPKVGDHKFGDFMEEKLKENIIRYIRFVYSNDMVPRLPYDDKDLMFKHFGKCLYYNWHYEGKVVPEEPNKNYYSPLGAIPMMVNVTVNVFCEMIRSFTILYTNGPDCREGWFLKVVWVVELVAHGIPAHSPQYVNATWLGSADLF
ncbi:LOW QUALITY PROTEIN: Lipase_3 domain-containing protein, partial [Cephalotus follicularis]